jgi:glycosyltransferase involved in cell wall biosynthesis
MKIAFCNRRNYDNPLGGDAVQMLKTKFWLEKQYDIQVDIVTDAKLLTTSYDIVHVFNYLTYEITETFINKAYQLHIPIVTSSIYWDYSYVVADLYYKVFNIPNCITEETIVHISRYMRLTALLFNKPRGISKKFKHHINDFINKSTLVLPNSQEEAELLLSFSGSNMSDKIKVVFNGVDIEPNSVFLGKDEFLRKYHIPDNYILQVGRMEVLKNQLNLLYSLMDDRDIPIVFVGRPVQQRYYSKLLELAGKRGNVFFISEVPHSEIALFYRYAAIHVLMSLRESPGLVNLEAMQENCPIVVPNAVFLPLHTYFSNAPYVANPLDISDIRNVVLNAYEQRQTMKLNTTLFSWSMAAQQTYNAYNEILNKNCYI